MLTSTLVFSQNNVLPEQLPRPVIDSYELSIKPSLDGDILNDSAWNNVIPATGFTQVQPNLGAPASQKTEVYMGFTDDAVYIGLVAYDENPQNKERKFGSCEPSEPSEPIEKGESSPCDRQGSSASC